MNSLAPISNSASLPTAEKKQRLSRWQFGLRTLLLLITLVGVWTSYFLNRQAVLKLKDRITAAQPLANELRVTDPTQAAIAGLPELWMDEFDWHYYLPPGKYQLCLATRQIGKDGKAPVIQKCPLAEGKHLLNLTVKRQSESHRIEITVDGKVGLSVQEPLEWNPSRSATGGSNFFQNEQVPANQPIFLFRRRFWYSDGSNRQPNDNDLVNGILLWIEAAPGGPADDGVPLKPSK